MLVDEVGDYHKCDNYSDHCLLLTEIFL